MTGKLVKSTPSPDPRNIPWLELTATPDPAKAGLLGAAVRVSRTETEGGIAPAMGCDTAHVGHTTRITYIATYTFWTR